jgi:hypothetical protein
VDKKEKEKENTICRPDIGPIKRFVSFRIIFRDFNSNVIPLLIVSYYHTIHPKTNKQTKNHFMLINS